MAPSLLRARRSAEVEFQGALGYGPTNCTKIRCRIGRLENKQNVIIRVRARLWVDTVEEVGKQFVVFQRALCFLGEDAV